MAKFLALTSRGLEPALYEELLRLGYSDLEEKRLGVEFKSNWEGCYKANLQLRSATRVLLPLLEFRVYQPDDLYHHVKKHDFTKYIHPDQTLSVDAKVRLSHLFRDHRFVAQRTKDAIVDQFRDRFGQRPSVDRQNADLQIRVRIVRNEVSLALDTSGESLAFHGYRSQTVMAPLKEHLAAGLLELADWETHQPLVDLMCGSGTILIEAALRAQQIAPGLRREKFGFEKLKNFNSDKWRSVRSQASLHLNHLDHLNQRASLPSHPVQFYGYDQNAQAIRAAKENAKKAGVADQIVFCHQKISQVQRPVENGLIIVNPPYGERLGHEERMRLTYSELSRVLKKEFAGWTCWLLSGNEELTSALRLKASHRHRVFNGTLDCRFLRYDLR